MPGLTHRQFCQGLEAVPVVPAQIKTHSESVSHQVVVERLVPEICRVMLVILNISVTTSMHKHHECFE